MDDAALGGTVVCCRDITAKAIYDAIATMGSRILAARRLC